MYSISFFYNLYLYIKGGKADHSFCLACVLYGQRSLRFLYCGLFFLRVKWIQTAWYIHFVVNSYWSALDIMPGSARVDCCMLDIVHLLETGEMHCTLDAHVLAGEPQMDDGQFPEQSG